jgi:DNA polymerase-4
MDKPDGLFVITPKQGPTFAERLSIGRFHGIGKATEARMKSLSIYNGADLKALPRHRLQRLFGKMGDYYYNVARGIDERPVVTERIRKSLSSEQTFERDIGETETMLRILERLAEKVAHDLQRKRLSGRTLSIKVKYDNFELITRSMTFNAPLQHYEQISPLLQELLLKTDAGQRKVRLLGVGVSNLSGDDGEKKQRQLELF